MTSSFDRVIVNNIAMFEVLWFALRRPCPSLVLSAKIVCSVHDAIQPIWSKATTETSIENKVDVHMKFGHINEVKGGNGVSGGGL